MKNKERVLNGEQIYLCPKCNVELKRVLTLSLKKTKYKCPKCKYKIKQ